MSRAKELTRRHQRLVQLAKMPEGRGAMEYDRLIKGGSMVESPAEKMVRQRQSQLAGMPNSKGKIDESNKLAMQAHKTRIQSQRKAQSMSAGLGGHAKDVTAAIKSQVQRPRNAIAPILQKRFGGKR